MQKVSVTVITFNEEKNIENCLKSVSFADEIVVVDSGSTDNTVEICKKYTDKVFSEKWYGYGKQKNLCAEYASNDWIFNIDSDEVVSEILAVEIKNLLTHDLKINTYRVNRKNYLGKTWIRHGAWFPDYITRLYNKKHCKFSEKIVHEAVLFEGKSIELKGHLEHYTYENLSDYFDRVNKYSYLSACEMNKNGKSSKVTDLLFRPIFGFIKNFIIKKGFLDGIYGLILSIGYSVYVFKKYVYLLEKEELKK